LFLACSAVNAAYSAYSFYDKVRQLDEATASFQDQLNRVNERISECPSSDTKKLAELYEIRNDLIGTLAQATAGSLSPSDTGLSEVSTALVFEAACLVSLALPTF